MLLSILKIEAVAYKLNTTTMGGYNLMALYVPKKEYIIIQDQRSTISTRYRTVTKAINSVLWHSTSNTAHSFYVGSYGRGTAIDTSDIDILVEMPPTFYVHSYTTYNPQSRLLQVVKNAIQNSYPRSDVRGDGQVVVIDFTDGIKFEVLPAIPQNDYWGRITSYKYPDSHMGGRWLSTNPKAEQEAIQEKNRNSNGLLLDTCKHMRYIRDNYFSSYHLSGIVIDSFVYVAMAAWQWTSPGGGSGAPKGDYESALLRYYNNVTLNGQISDFMLNAPGSGDSVSTSDSTVCLGKVLKKMTE